ncbi:MAG: hypothetical protein CMJ78_13150 [Planctomycetaceae bacterium]|nr:hypothetical protein [Planctomycetaceae bacterium]
MTDRDPVDRLAEEFASRLRSGENPSISGYVAKYPEHADQIQNMFPTVALMERLAIDSELSASTQSKKRHVEHPSELGGFRIESEIGRGGMGVVYKAEQVALSRHVALKVLPSQWLATPNQRKRFEREARAAARLHHTNIIPVFGIGEDHGTHFYAMQHIVGRSLDEVLRELKRTHPANHTTRESQIDHQAFAATISEQQADSFEETPEAAERDGSTQTNIDTDSLKDSSAGTVTVRPVPESVPTNDVLLPTPASYWHQVALIGIQIAEALEYAHSKGILHRDIKPSNLMVDAQGTVWVADFGLAIFDDEVKITETGDVVGTLQYLAPERFDGVADARSDIYSLGLTLYELLALRPGFDARNRKALVKQILEGEPPQLRKLNPNVPRDLETIVQKAVERSADNRIQSAGELAADLRRFIDDEPIHSRRVSAAERFGRWCRRNPGISWTTATATVLLLVTVSTAFVLVNNERRTAVQLAAEKTALAKTKEAQAKKMSDLARRNAELADEERRAMLKEHIARTRLQSLLSSETELRAEAETSQRQAERFAAESKAVTDFLLMDMIGIAVPERSKGRTISVQTMLDQAAIRVEHAFEDQPNVEASIRNTIGSAYYSLGEYTKAQKQLTRALALREETLGSEAVETLGTMLNLSAVYYALGQLEDAGKLEQEAYHTLHVVVGPDDPQTLNALNSFAANLHAQGKYPQAKKYFESVLNRRTQILGANHVDTLVTAANLAMTLDAMGLVIEAGKLHQSTTEARLVTLGSDHPSTLVSLGNLAVNLDKQKQYAKAEELHRQVLAGRRKVLGADHPKTLATVNNLAVNLGYQDKHEAAQKLYEELVEEYTRQLGGNHPSTLTVMNNLATNLQSRGKYERAEELFRKVYATLRMALGDTHPSTLTVLDNLGHCFDLSKKYAEAEQAFSVVLRGRQKIFGPRHPQTLVVVHALGKVMLAQKKHEEAETLLRESLDLHRTSLPDGHWLTASAQSLLGESLMGLGQLDKAEPMVLDGYRGMKASEGRFEPRLIRQAADRIVRLYQLWNKPGEAEKWKRELMQ